MNADRFFRPRVEQLEDRSVPSNLPLGFAESTFASGLSAPTAMEFAPDGRLFVAQQTGQVRVILSNGTLLPTPFLTLSVNSTSERGLTGITFDPNFSSNGFVYVYYTTSAATPVNRVSRFTVSSGDANLADPASEKVLLDGIASTNGNHNGGALHFGNDGKLYVGVGEAGVPANSRTLSNLSGKVLRINSDGTIPGDNPFVSTPGARGEIWANGFRNPFTFNVDPATGTILVNDVGANTFEEVDLLVKGGDYGWALAEGPAGIPGLIDPVHSYAHNGRSSAITGGVFYHGANFPGVYDGSYFFADYINGFIRRLDGNLLPREFVTGASSPVDLDVGPDGSLYLLSLLTGQVQKITHVGLAHNLVVVGSGTGAVVTQLDAVTHETLRSFTTYQGFNGGVNVALAELTGDDVPDVITGSSAGAHVKVFDGATGESIRSFLPFPGFTGEVFVAAGDIDNDGTPDIIVGAGAGATPHVKVFSGKDNSLLRSFYAYVPGFSGGVRVASADFDHDGQDDIVTGAGPGAGPHVEVFSGSSLALLASFYAYSPDYHGGVWVAAGDLDGDGKAEIITGASAGAPHVRVFNGGDTAERASFYAYAPTFTGGVRVGVGDTDGDGTNEVLTGAGPGAGPHVKVDRLTPFAEIDSYFALAPSFTGGIFVAGE